MLKIKSSGPKYDKISSRISFGRSFSDILSSAITNWAAVHHHSLIVIKQPIRVLKKAPIKWSVPPTLQCMAGKKASLPYKSFTACS
jgi:hypothetical protein